MKNTIITYQVGLPEEPRDVPQYLEASRQIIKNMTGNAHFPAPPLSLTDVSDAIDIAGNKAELARNGGLAAFDERKVAVREVHSQMHMLRAYVQRCANADPERAEVIIKSAGMKVGKRRTASKPATSAKVGDAIGSVVLSAKALPGPVYYRWQMSTDQQTWTDLPETFKTKTIVDGLVPATVYSFRLKTVTKNGPSEWSAPVTVIAH